MCSSTSSPLPSGESTVEQHHVDRAVDPIDRLGGCLGEIYVVSLFEEAGVQRGDIRLVLDDEDRWIAHRRSPPGSTGTLHRAYTKGRRVEE